MQYFGDFAEDATVRYAFTTNDGSGGAVAPSSAFEAADFKIYKNGSATEKATTNGITITSPFDAETSTHIIEIDTSNDTGDSGFWATGADYWVFIGPDETVDGQTVEAFLFCFSIENRFTNVNKISGSSTAADNAETVYDTDFATNYDASNDRWSVGVVSIGNNVVTAASLATDAVTEIQSGLLTSTAFTNALPTNFGDLAITSTTGRVDVGAWVGTTVTLSSTTGKPEVDIHSISDDSTAANNCELMFDGTGYSGGNTRLRTDMYGVQGSSLTGFAGLNAKTFLENGGSLSSSTLQDIYSLRTAHVVATSTVDNSLADATTTVFKTALTEADDFWNDLLLVFVSGDLAGQAKPILDYSQTNGTITLDEALTDVPANGVAFRIVANHIHPVSQIADGVWDEPTAGHATAATTGKALADALADTSELQTDWTDGGRLDLILDATLAMLDNARSEPGQGAPPVNPDAMTKLDYLYKAWRNKKTQTSSEIVIFADDGTTEDHAATVSDDGTTTTVGEMGTGA